MDALTQVIELPSKGLELYPKEHPLYNGTIEIKYPTARDEDILSDKSLIKNQTVLDKFIENIIADSSAKEEFIKGNVFSFDKDAIVLHSRILAYGSSYEPTMECPNCNHKFKDGDIKINLEDVKYKVNKDLSNLMEVILPISKKKIMIKFSTVKDDKDQIASEKKLKEFKIKSDGPITSLLKNSIFSVDGNVDRTFISSFVDSMLSKESLFLRSHITEVTPSVDMSFEFICTECGEVENLTIPVDVTFFWPKLG